MKGIIIFILIFCLGLHPQVKQKICEKVEINTIKISDSSFYKLLDVLLQHERKCSYYTDSLPYGIWVGKAPTDGKDSVVVVRISGHEEKGLFLSNKLLGFLPYKGHNFFIRGDNLISSLVITEKKKTFQYHKNLHVDDDDSWAIYYFAYYDNQYMLYDRANTYRCKCK